MLTLKQVQLPLNTKQVSKKKVATAEEYFRNYMANWVSFNWGSIKASTISEEIAPLTKNELVDKIHNDTEEALWVLNDLSWWGMKKERMLKDLFQRYEGYENDVFYIVKLHDKYIKYVYSSKDGFSVKMEFVEPKTKTVIYFD